MEINWLHDFIAVATTRSFSRAAEERNCSQPALSRRIQSLEVWAGASLLERTTHSVNLTPAGEAFRHTAEDILRRLNAGRIEAQERARGVSDVLKFASTNALSLTFFPDWLRRIEAELSFVPNVQLVANHMESCSGFLWRAMPIFLLCHYHPAATTALRPSHFRSLHVGDDHLIPASVPTSRRNRKPRFKLPGTEGAPVQSLSFRSESGWAGQSRGGSHHIAAASPSPYDIHFASREAVGHDGSGRSRHGVAPGKPDRRSACVRGHCRCR